MLVGRSYLQEAGQLMNGSVIQCQLEIGMLGWIMPARIDGLHLQCQPLEAILRGRLYNMNKELYHLEQPLNIVINVKKIKFESLHCFIAVKYLLDGQTTTKITERSSIAMTLLTEG